MCRLNFERTPHYGPGSKAEAEQSDSKWSAEILNAWTIGNGLMESACEHIALFVKAITEPVEAIACWTCIRSMLEPCALAAWLFDPDLDASKRAGRVFALRYDGFDQQVKFGRTAGYPQSVMEELTDKIVALEQQALRLGFRPLRGDKKKRTGVGIVMPKTTPIIGQMLGLEPTYRLLSAVAHGHHWAILRLSFCEVSESSNFTMPTGLKMTVLEKNLSIQAFVFLVTTAIEAFRKAASTQFRFVGAPTADIESLVGETLDKLAQAYSFRRQDRQASFR